MLMSFIGASVLTMVQPSFAKAAKSMGGNAWVTDFFLYALLAGSNMIGVGIFTAFKGLVRDPKRRVKLKLKYDEAAYLPWGEKLLLHYGVMCAVGFATGAVFEFAAKPVADSGLPVGINTLLAWAPGFWLTVWVVWPGRKAMRQVFRGEASIVEVWRHRLWIPLLGCLQLAGVGLMVVSAHKHAMDGWLIFHPLVLTMVTASVASSILSPYTKRLRRSNERMFTAATGIEPEERRGSDGSNERVYPRDATQFMSGLMATYNSFFPALVCVAAYVVCGCTWGFSLPHGETLPWLGLLLLGGQGSRLTFMANLRGKPVLCGFAAVASLIFTPYWNRRFQHLPYTHVQQLGSLLIIGCAFVLLLMSKELRTLLWALLSKVKKV